MRLGIGRTLVALAAACIGAFGVVSPITYAQTPGVENVGWDYRDPVNIAESRVYARLWFEFKDTGVVSPEFQAFRFTNPAPRSPMTPFYGAEKLLEKLYAHRLIPWSDGTPGMYGLTELMRDDPEVEAAFRLYATTGKVVTPFDGDATLVVNHLLAVEDAAAESIEFGFIGTTSIALIESNLESDGLVATGVGTGELVSVVSLPSDVMVETIRQDLPGVPPGTGPGLHPYWPDNEAPCRGGPDDGYRPDDGFCLSPGHSGFDCDDYARAWAAYLKHHLAEYPDAEYFLLYFFWGDPQIGHAVVAILIDGKYYLVDPQSGIVLGPIEEGTWLNPTDFKPKLKRLLHDRYRVPDPGEIIVEKHPPDYVGPKEPRPWYEDPDVLEWWRQNFPGQDPNDYIWS